MAAPDGRKARSPMSTIRVTFPNRDAASFSDDVKSQVADYFTARGLSDKADWRMVLKGVLLVALTFVPYGMILSNNFGPWTMLGLAVLMGVGVAGIGFSVSLLVSDLSFTVPQVELGKANVALFESVSRRLFRSATRVSPRPAGAEAARFDAIIEPAVAAFEFSLPSQSATDQYSVWIRYTVKVFRPDGTELTAWNISAYGESDSTLLRPARSMEQATILALRDAAAMLAVDFATEARARGVMPMEKTDAPTP